MSRFRLNDPVIGPDGETTTIATLATQGKIKFREVLMTTKNGTVTQYFADFGDTGRGFQIGKTAYLGRIGKKPSFP